MNNRIRKIAINHEVLPQIFKDLQRDLHNEMAGFVIGCILSVKGELWLYIVDSCPASDYDSTRTGVRINPRSFLYLDKILEQKYKRKCICVGWYHSHPFNSNFVQPSSTDKQTIYKSFSKYYHVSLIIDPISHCKDIWKVENGEIISVKDRVLSVVPRDK